MLTRHYEGLYNLVKEENQSFQRYHNVLCHSFLFIIHDFYTDEHKFMRNLKGGESEHEIKQSTEFSKLCQDILHMPDCTFQAINIMVEFRHMNVEDISMFHLNVCILYKWTNTNGSDQYYIVLYEPEHSSVRVTAVDLFISELQIYCENNDIDMEVIEKTEISCLVGNQELIDNRMFCVMFSFFWYYFFLCIK